MKTHLRFPAASILLLVLLSCSGVKRQSSPDTGLADIYREYFPIGAAVNSATVDTGAALLKEHFVSITAENEMKPSVAYPVMNKPRLHGADRIADFARANDMMMRGHCFVWNQQAPGWYFISEGQPAGRELLLERVGGYMVMMAERYGDVVDTWDVVNEAVSDEGPELLKDSPYLDIIGEDYVAESFRLARAAAPDARLFYNDYNVLDPGKQERILELLEGLLADGVPVDGIGIQGHWNINYPDGGVLAEAIDRFAALGLEVQITELDISMYDWNDRSDRHGSDVPTGRLLRKQAGRYAEIFEVLRSRGETVTGVTFWGVADDASWLHDYPVANRRNWPLLFDENHEPKPAFDAVARF